AVLLADAAVSRFVPEMGVNVDEPGHHHQVAPIDNLICSAREVGTDVEDAIFGESDVDTAMVDMLARRPVPGDRPICSLDQRLTGHCFTSSGRPSHSPRSLRKPSREEPP